MPAQTLYYCNILLDLVIHYLQFHYQAYCPWKLLHQAASEYDLMDLLKATSGTLQHFAVFSKLVQWMIHVLSLAFKDDGPNPIWGWEGVKQTA